MLKKIWYSICTSCRYRRSKTVKLAFPLVVFATILASAVVLSDSKSYITVTAEPPTVKKGDIFFVTVTATAGTPINAVDIVLEYPQSQIEVTGVDTGGSVITLWTEEPYAEDGSVYIRGGTFGQGFVGEHTIARVRAEAIESGTAYISTDSARMVAGDGKGTEVAIDEDGTNESKIYITNEDGSAVGNATVQIITDVNGDGEVNLSDISAFMSAWFSRDTTFDFNGDGHMSFRDFSILLADAFFN